MRTLAWHRLADDETTGLTGFQGDFRARVANWLADANAGDAAGKLDLGPNIRNIIGRCGDPE
jgi:hypothetical protein